MTMYEKMTEVIRMLLTAEALDAELFAEIMTAEDQGFTLRKTLGAVECKTDADGNPLWDGAQEARREVEQNAAAVRLLGERHPELKITYPQTVISEKTVRTDETEAHFTATRTDAVIEVPDTFVMLHSGSSFRQLLVSEWSEQLNNLVEQITKRLRRHEMRTAKMFGKNPDAASARFQITEDLAASEIWTIPLAHCGFYPLQWDAEICGMALLLAKRLKETLADDCGSMLETSVRRDPKQKCCSVVIYYSIKQD